MPAEEMHAVPGRNEGPRCDVMRACVLLGLYRGLGEGEARMPAVQEGSDGAAHFAVASCIAWLVTGESITV